MITFSIIIPVKPGRYVAAADHLCKIMSDDFRYEIILVEGNAPSQQRNMAAKEAVGDILYFLDDDSLISLDNFAICSEIFSNSTVAVAGGPSLTPSSDSWLQQLLGSALATKFGSGAVRNRYRMSGSRRETTEKELILCNLAVRRLLFLELGGFDERLYPNEENELLDRIKRSGHKLLHLPEMFVFRSQRSRLKLFIRQMFVYGRGRAQQTFISGSFSLVSFVPLFFTIYLTFVLIFPLNMILQLPLVLYFMLNVFYTLAEFARLRTPSTLLLCFLYPLMHVVNGCGLFIGLLGGKPPLLVDTDIVVRKIKPIGACQV